MRQTFDVHNSGQSLENGIHSKHHHHAGLYEEYLEQCTQPKEGSSFRTKVSHYCECRPISWLFSLFPILSWLPKYKFREDLTHDLVAAITVSVMQIPQGMAYALLANVQAVVGIYMAFFPIIVYSIMGNSKHISMGTFAVTCLMTGKTVTELHTKYSYTPPPTLNDSSLLSGAAPGGDTHIYKYTPEQIATVVSLMTGIFQILMGTLRLGFLCVLLSSDLVSGFTTGAAIHVFTSQVKSLLGLSIKRRTGIFKIPLTYYDIFSHIEESNVTAIIFSVVTLSCLIIYNEVLKPRVAKKISFPIPIELFAVIGGTLVSRYLVTSKDYGFPIVNSIPTGFPPPALPPLELIKDVLVDSLIMAIVAYTISISMAKIFAAKHGYEVPPNQELLANGSSNILGSFFSCAPISCSLSRSVIQEQVGGRSQLAGLFSCIIIIFVLLWIAPFFETLPLCVLSSMILVALRGMLLQLLEVPAAFRESILNAGVWSVTFLATVFLDIEYGLGLGILAAVLNLVWRSNRPHCSLVSVHVDSLDGAILVEADSPCAKYYPGIRIVRCIGSLNFATVEYFAKRVQVLVPPIERSSPSPQLTQSTTSSSSPRLAPQHSTIGGLGKRKGSLLEGVMISTIIPEEEAQNDHNNTGSPSPSSSNEDINEFSLSTEQIFSGNNASHRIKNKAPHQENSGINNNLNKEEINWLILDLSSVSSVDPAAAKTLTTLTKLYLKKDINLIFVGAAPPLITVMDKIGLLKVAGTDHFHPSVAAALTFLQKGLVVRRRSSLRPPQLDSSLSYSTSTGSGIRPGGGGLGGGEILEEEVVLDDGDYDMISQTAAYFRRLSKSSLHDL